MARRGACGSNGFPYHMKYRAISLCLPSVCIGGAIRGRRRYLAPSRGRRRSFPALRFDYFQRPRIARRYAVKYCADAPNQRNPKSLAPGRPPGAQICNFCGQRPVLSLITEYLGSAGALTREASSPTRRIRHHPKALPRSVSRRIRARGGTKDYPAGRARTSRAPAAGNGGEAGYGRYRAPPKRSRT